MFVLFFSCIWSGVHSFCKRLYVFFVNLWNAIYYSKKETLIGYKSSKLKFLGRLVFNMAFETKGLEFKLIFCFLDLFNPHALHVGGSLLSWHITQPIRLTLVDLPVSVGYMYMWVISGCKVFYSFFLFSKPLSLTFEDIPFNVTHHVENLYMDERVKLPMEEHWFWSISVGRVHANPRDIEISLVV